MSSHALPAQPRVGDRIAAARREHGFTQKQLAERLGISVWLVDQLEAGAVAPDRYLEPIAEATSVEVDRLREGDAVPAAPARAVASTMTTMDVLGRAAILGAIVMLVVVRFFTEVVPVVPRAANFVDIPIFLALATLAAFAPLMRQGPRRFYLRFGFPSFVFLVPLRRLRGRSTSVASRPRRCSSSSTLPRAVRRLRRRCTGSGPPGTPSRSAGRSWLSGSWSCSSSR